MSAEEDVAVVKTFIEEVINSGNLEKVDELVAPDHVNNDPTAPAHARGVEGIKELIGAYRAGFPDLRLETSQMFAFDGKVARHWSMRGTHEGESMEIKPIGNKVEAMGEINHVDKCVLPATDPRFCNVARRHTMVRWLPTRRNHQGRTIPTKV